MKESELLRKQADMMDMAEKYGIKDWQLLVRYQDRTYGIMNAHCGELARNIEYQFALAVVEGKAVFEGDVLWYMNGDKFVWNPCIDYSPPDDTTNWSKCTWNPPKPKTVMVELTVEDAEAIATFFKVSQSPNYQRAANACRKALENQ